MRQTSWESTWGEHISSSLALSAALAGIAGVVGAVNYSVHPISGFRMVDQSDHHPCPGRGWKDWSGLCRRLVLGLAEGISVYFVGADYREVVGLVIFILVLLKRSL